MPEQLGSSHDRSRAHAAGRPRLNALLALALILAALGAWSADVPRASAQTSTIVDWGALGNLSALASVSFSDVSCPTATYCVAVGSGGAVWAWNGTSWTSQNSGVLTALNGVSCASTGLCAAVGDGGVIRLWNGTIWSAQSSPGTLFTLYDVSCPATNRCVAVGEGGKARDWSGNNWNQQNLNASNNFNGVSCVSTTQCVAVGDGGVIRALSGSNWSTQTSAAANNLNGVSCASATSCIAVGAGGTVQFWNGTTWTATPASGTTSNLNDVSCTTATSCVAVGAGGTILGWNGSAWGTPSSVTKSNLNGVSCTATGRCVAVGAGGTVIASVQITLNGVSGAFALDLINVSCLTSVTVTQVNQQPENAPPNIRTGRYWQITPSTETCPTPYNATLTLPFGAADPGDEVCRYTGIAQTWDCSATTFSANSSVTRANITQLSTWAVRDDDLPTPVTLVDLSVARGAGGVAVHWATAGEVGVIGFQLLRGPGPERAAAAPVGELIPAEGDSLTGASYEWVDAAAPEGAHYWLQVVNRDGTPEEYGPVRLEAPAPSSGENRVFLPLVRQ